MGERERDLFTLEKRLCERNFTDLPQWALNSTRLSLLYGSTSASASAVSLDPSGISLSLSSIASEKGLKAAHFYTLERLSLSEEIAAPWLDMVVLSRSSMSTCLPALVGEGKREREREKPEKGCWPLTYVVRWVQRRDHSGESCIRAYRSLQLLDFLFGYVLSLSLSLSIYLSLSLSLYLSISLSLSLIECIFLSLSLSPFVSLSLSHCLSIVATLYI